MLKLTCLLLLFSAYASASETSDILSRLFKKNTRNATPLILVMDRNTLRPLNSINNRDESYEKAGSNYDASDDGDDSLQYIVHQLDQLRKSHRNHSTSHHHHHRAVSHSSRQDRLLDRHQERLQDRYQDRQQDKLQVRYQNKHQDRRQDRYQDRHQDRHYLNELQDRMQDLEKPGRPVSSRLHKEEPKVKSVLRSPIYKSLLSLRNSLRCGARVECRNECEDNYKGKRKYTCEVECEEKFECDEPRDKCEDSDECNNSVDECADSDDDQCQGSTKGVTLVTEKPGCTRC